MGNPVHRSSKGSVGQILYVLLHGIELYKVFIQAYINKV